MIQINKTCDSCGVTQPVELSLDEIRNDDVRVGIRDLIVNLIEVGAPDDVMEPLVEASKRIIDHDRERTNPTGRVDVIQANREAYASEGFVVKGVEACEKGDADIRSEASIKEELGRRLGEWVTGTKRGASHPIYGELIWVGDAGANAVIRHTVTGQMGNRQMDSVVPQDTIEVKTEVES